MSTPSMGLTQSTPLVTPGPAWAQNIETDLLLIDQHDHTVGKGVPVPVAGLNINDDLPFGSNAAIGLLATAYISNGGTLAGSRRVYVVGGDLYYNNGSSTPIQLTSGGSINVSGVGGITGLAGTTGALTYSDITKTFSFTQDANKTASIAAGTVFISEPGVSSAPLIGLKSPTSLAGAYNVTFPAALPVSSKYLTISSSGVLTATDAVDNSTLEVSSGNIRIKDLGVTTAKLANNAVDDTKIRQGGACSIIGRSANSTGNVADISASTNGYILQRSADAVIWGLAGDGNFADGTLSRKKLSTAEHNVGSQVSTSTSSSSYGSDVSSVSHTVRYTNQTLIVDIFGSHISCADNGAGGTFERTGYIGFFIDGSLVHEQVISCLLADANAYVAWPASTFRLVVDNLAAGSHTFSFRIRTAGTTNTLIGTDTTAIQVLSI